MYFWQKLVSSGKENSILKDRLSDFGDGELTFSPRSYFLGLTTILYFG